MRARIQMFNKKMKRKNKMETKKKKSAQKFCSLCGVMAQLIALSPHQIGILNERVRKCNAEPLRQKQEESDLRCNIWAAMLKHKMADLSGQFWPFG